MKKQLFLLLTTVFTINSYSQIVFEKGYYINNSGNKIDCLIKNVDWKNNPTEFEYKQAENSNIKKATIEIVKEFGIYNISKYYRKTVKIDRSSENINRLNESRNPIFKEEQLFLRVLVEGKANLYLYEDGTLKRYFYNIENYNVEQLIFKSFKISDNKIGKNNQFKQQLLNTMKCSTIKMDKIKNLDYKKNSLVRFFIEYNKCNNSKFVNFEKKQKIDLFNLTFRPRINNSSLTIENSISDSRNTDFGNRIGIGIGIELEFILPFNKNKWAVLIEPTYQNFKSEKTTDLINVPGEKLITEVNYSSIEIPVSLRYYFFLNNNSKIFVNASYIIDLTAKSSIDFKRVDNFNLNSLDIDSMNNLAFGIGYKFNDKYSLEIRYQTSREILTRAAWGSDYNTSSIIFGYSIF